MVKSHRSSNTLFNTWAHDPLPTPTREREELLIPGSPSQLDPFGSNPRPPSVVTPTTLTIILASPSTSTIHYLFPSSDTQNHLRVTGKPLVRSQSTGSRQRLILSPSRGSLDQSETEKSVERKIPENAFPLPPSRSVGSIGRGIPNPLGPVKRIPSATSTGSVKKADISKPIVASPSKPKDRSTMVLAPAKTLHRQPSITDLKVEISEQEMKGGPKRKESLVFREIAKRRERRSWEVGSGVSLYVSSR